MKRLAAVLAALMVLSCGTTVLAANSSTAEALAKDVKATTSTGVAATIKAVTEEVKTEAVKEAVKENASSEVVALVEVSVEGTGKVTLTFDVPGVAKGDNIYLLHQKADKTWEVIHPSAVEDGKVTATFNSLSPVAIVKVPAGEKLPAMGVSVVLPLAALVCAAGATGCARKVKFN